MNTQLRQDLVRTSVLIGVSKQAQEIRERAAILGGTPHSVLIQGESGVGKELVAKEIHENGRYPKPFVAVNCATLTETLIESELFGHMKGSFTGAYEDRKGFFETAEDGTIFLDEVGTIPVNQQAKLLRVLQERVFYPVGSRRHVAVAARIIAGTNVDLEKIGFRDDLFYRLNVMPFMVPPLRERLDDIPVLAEHFLRQEGCISQEFSWGALKIMTNYRWPGNVRELQNVVSRVAVFSYGNVIQAEDVQRHIPVPKTTAGVAESKSENNKFPTEKGAEKSYLEQILAETRGHVASAAHIAGISPKTLHFKIKKFSLKEFVVSQRGYPK